MFSTSRAASAFPNQKNEIDSPGKGIKRKPSY